LIRVLVQPVEVSFRSSHGPTGTAVADLATFPLSIDRRTELIGRRSCSGAYAKMPLSRPGNPTRWIESLFCCCAWPAVMHRTVLAGCGRLLLRELSRTSRTSSSIFCQPSAMFNYTTRLRCARQNLTIYAQTNRYKNSFILFGLNHFQRCDFVYFVYA